MLYIPKTAINLVYYDVKEAVVISFDILAH